jgi:prolipoprotein diacylglyceryl transferase
MPTGVPPIPGFIPSPSNGTFNLGPIPIHVYGLLLAVGVIVGTLITERRWQRWGHDRREISNIIVVVVICGVAGARLYTALTDPQRYYGHWIQLAEIWRGGLSIWGVIIGGSLGVIVMTRRHHYDTLGIMDAMTVGILVAQGIGRWGNYFNQELFGKPTRLPWGLAIDLIHRPPGYTQFTTFNPTFLYESIYCFALVGVMLWAERRFVLRRGQSVALYIATYTFGRFWFENLRIDPAHHIFGLRVNAWVALFGCLAAIVVFWLLGRNGRVDPSRYPDAAPPTAVPSRPAAGDGVGSP